MSLWMLLGGCFGFLEENYHSELVHVTLSAETQAAYADAFPLVVNVDIEGYAAFEPTLLCEPSAEDVRIDFENEGIGSCSPPEVLRVTVEHADEITVDACSNGDVDWPPVTSPLDPPVLREESGIECERYGGGDSGIEVTVDPL